MNVKVDPVPDAQGQSYSCPGDELARPHDNCYWLLTHRIIAGEYPGALDQDEARSRLRAILAVGVTNFVDLTTEHELSPYDALLQGLATVQNVKVTYARHAVPDLGVPNVSQMRSILDAIAACAAGITYVHCWGGVGRTGTVAGCLLVEAGFTPQEALRILADKWQVMEKRRRCPRTPEMPEQFRFIEAWPDLRIRSARA
jgi:protein-tyrosine phosphatase